MKLKIKAGTTNKIMRLRIQDTSGSDLAGLTYNSVGLSGYFCREGDTQVYPLPLSSGNIGVWSSGGFISVSDGLMPGIYELGLPNHLIQSGYKSVIVLLKGASSMASNASEIELDAIDYQNPVPNQVWDAQTASYNVPNSFGEVVGAIFGNIYYADIELINDIMNSQDEYGVQWFKNGNPLASGDVTNAAFSVYNGNTGAALFTNRTLSYVNTTTGFLTRTETTLTDSGVPYLVKVSGTIDSSTRYWDNVLGKQT